MRTPMWSRCTFFAKLVFISLFSLDPRASCAQSLDHGSFANRTTFSGDNGPKTRKPYTNGVSMKFVWIPPGAFTMGSPSTEKGRGDDEIPRKVTITKGFYLGVHTVTQEQWQAVMGEN